MTTDRSDRKTYLGQPVFPNVTETRGDPDREWEQGWEQERHSRRMKLMRMQGDINRLETRMYIGYAVAGVLTVLALLFMGMS